MQFPTPPPPSHNKLLRRHAREAALLADPPPQLAHGSLADAARFARFTDTVGDRYVWFVGSDSLLGRV